MTNDKTTDIHAYRLPTPGKRAEVIASGSDKLSTRAGSSPIPSIMAVKGRPRVDAQ